jgi:dihydroxyacid dehydratase/phosphogluconate dehydratase
MISVPSLTKPMVYAGHVTPEARVGGPIALVEDGDRIVIDSVSKVISWSIDKAEQARRREVWEKSDKRNLTVKRGVLYRYARDVAVSSTDWSCNCLRTDGTFLVRRRWGLLRLSKQQMYT